MAPTAKELRRRAEDLFRRAGAWHCTRQRSLRLHRRALSLERAARLAERRERRGVR
jgi:hypothetical protein